MIRLFSVLATIACLAGPAPANPNVLCTTGMIADVARNIAGERAQVTSLMGEGVDPHLYKPTRSDIASILRADIIFYNGLHLEGKMTDALTRADRAGRSVHAVGETIDQSTIRAHKADDSMHTDPHIWMDPSAWAQIVGIVEQTLIEHDPDGSEQYQANAQAYRVELAKLDTYADRALSSIPETSRVLVTAHDAFGYLGARYNMEVVGIQGISTESEAGLRDIERLVSLLVDRKIGAVFVESTVSERNIKALIEGAKARGHAVIIGGELFSDAMGAPGTYEGTYVGMIDHNVTIITRALGGEAPARGMQGKLKP